MPRSPKRSKSRGKKKRKRERSPDVTAAAMKLLTYAATGKTRRVRKLLDKAPSMNIDTFDAEGLTALHHACRFGHQDTAQLLLERGADIEAEDVQGNTAAHLAAARGHYTLLTLLLQASPPPNIDKRNAKGVTVRSLAAAMMDQDDITDWRSGQPVEPSPSPQASSSEAEDEGQDAEAAWRELLAAEAAAEDGNPFGAAGWGTPGWVEGAEADDPGVPWGGPQETEDEFAARIWAEMQRRRNAHATEAARVFNAERQAAADKRKAAEAEAYQRSQKILEEELARDRAWRDAVKQGDLGVRRAKYEARWHAFAAAAASAAEVAFDVVPWMVEAENASIESLVFYGTSGPDEQRKPLRMGLRCGIVGLSSCPDIELGGALDIWAQRSGASVAHGAYQVAPDDFDGPDERRKRLRMELMRWHPDKFEARFGRRLAVADRDRILARVKGVSQALNALGK